MPRPDEEGDQGYHFVSEETFRQMIDDEMFLEHAEVFGHLYGTSKGFVSERLSDGYGVVLELDWQGARSVREAFADTVTICILPPSEQDLHKRLIGRGQDSQDVIKGRMNEAMSEMMHYHEFDYIVVNDEFDRAQESLRSIMLEEYYSEDDAQLAADAVHNLGLEP